jgi:mono/diheme cytochrome c family protein
VNRAVATLVALAGLLLVGVPGPSDATPSAGETARRPPARLSETGLYLGHAPEVDPHNLAYSPQYPLWSDGAGKSRWVYLPPGSRIDAKNADAWVFPVGTKFWKEFAFGGRKVETRLIWKAAAGSWVFATYLWNDDPSDAVLAPADGVPDYYQIAPGKRHTIPGVRDCRDCHEDERTPLLGFNALQLSTDRDPLAPHAEPLRPGMITLATLVERGLLSPARREFLTHPPRIPGDPHARAVLGYFTTNCGSCHRAAGSLGFLGLDFADAPKAADEASEPGFATTVGRTGKWGIPGVPAGETRRIAPGAPEKSSVFYRMSSRRASSQMPPLGTVLVDHEAVELLRSWIAEDLPRR